MPITIARKIQRENNKYIHEKSDTFCVKDYNHSFLLMGRKIGPFKQGLSYKIENYIAHSFVEEGYLIFEDASKITSNTIRKINFQESTNPELRKIQDHIYVQTLNQIKVMQSLNQKGKGNRREISQIFSDITDLIRVRLSKINRLASQTSDLKSTKVLTPEENILFEEISNTIKQWRDVIGKMPN